MPHQSRTGDPSPGEIAETDHRHAEAATIADQHAEAAETMEDHQRLLFENAQRIAGIEAAEK